MEENIFETCGNKNILIHLPQNSPFREVSCNILRIFQFKRCTTILRYEIEDDNLSKVSYNFFNTYRYFQ